MNKSVFSRARVGDRVWSPFGPDCEVRGTNAVVRNEQSGNTVPVLLDCGKNLAYWLDGRYQDTDSFPSLFWSRPAIEIPPPPPKRMKKVEVEVRPWRDIHGRIILLSSDDMRYLNCGPVQTIKVEVYG